MSRAYLTITVAVLSAFAMNANAQTTTSTTYTQASSAKTDMSNVVRARFVKPGDVSPEEYQRLLAEADKIRAYQAAQGQYAQGQYNGQYGATAQQPAYGQPIQYQYAQPQSQTYQNPQSVQVSNGQIQGPFYQAQTQTVPAQPVQNQPRQQYVYGQTYQAYPTQNTQQQAYVPVQPQPIQVQPVQPRPVQAQTVPTTFATPQIAHSVVKGDTLYNISKRYGVPLSTIRGTNNLTTNTISIGQRIIIPSVQKIISTPASTAPVPVQTYSQPQYVAPVQPQPVQPQYVPQTYQVQPSAVPVQNYPQPTTYKPVSYQGTYPGTLTYQRANQVRTNATGTNSPRLIRSVQPVPPSGVYAVLPKDTLYSISKIACVSSDDIAKINGITDVSTLQPGQKLSMPAGHCLR